jgi:hypothetical protein
MWAPPTIFILVPKLQLGNATFLPKLRFGTLP